MTTRRSFFKKAMASIGVASIAPTKLLSEQEIDQKKLIKAVFHTEISPLTEYTHYNLGFSISKQLMEDDKHQAILHKRVDQLANALHSQIDEDLGL